MDASSLAELKAFDATAQTGSMSGAARLLGLRQPTVSAHIANLERRFGIELFVRRARGVELTEFGHVLRDVTHRIYRAEDEVQSLLLDVRNQYQGRLRLAAIGPYNVSPMIRRFRELWPRVKVVVRMGDSRKILEQVLDHRSDLGVVLHAVDDARIHCVAYRRQRLVVFAPRGHPLEGRSLRIEDLEGEEFVVREEGSRTRHVFDQGLASAGVRIRRSVEMGSREAVREAVAQGLGLGVVAETAYVPDPRLVMLDMPALGLHTHAHVICLLERRGAPLVSRFLGVVDTLRERG